MGSRSLLRKSALLSGLVTEAQLDQAAQAVRERHGAERDTLAADEHLARWLVEQQALTLYQAEQLMAGRTKLSLGPYLITDWIGQGGMGQVFKAVHRVMGREVAVKVLPLTRSTPEAIHNFTREIRTQAQLNHPNLVRADDAGQDGNVHYLVTEFVPGADLRRLVRSHGPLTVEQAATVISQAAKGLQYAHKQGLLHRDVKPGNLLVTPEGVTKVSDLGLAGFLDEGDRDPRAGRIVGTADYIAPEVIKSPRDMSQVSDIYSLGCTLYYAVTGKVPFPGGSTRDKLHRHCEQTPYHPRRFQPNIPEEFVEVIGDMMQKEPAERLHSAGEVVNRLESWSRDGAGPRPEGRIAKSPWTLPPPPSESAEDLFDLQLTGSGSHDPVDFDSSSSSASSQGTDAMATQEQETRRFPEIRRRSPAPAIPQPERRSGLFGRQTLLLALAVPTGMLVGALLMLLLVRWLT